MKLSRLSILLIGLLSGLTAGLSTALIIGTNDDLRENIFGRVTPTAVLGSGDLRAPMSRENVDEFTYYTTDYLNTYHWLELHGVELKQDVADQFVRIEEIITFRNLEEQFEDSKGVVSTVLSLFYDTMLEEIPFTAQNVLAVCLALEDDLRLGRNVHLYFRLPNDVEMDFPDDWAALPSPPEEQAGEWQSECLETF